MTTLYYLHDPMCSWCWGIRPTLQQLQATLPEDIGFKRVLGGLAEDTDEPLPDFLRERLADTWRRIQETIPGTEFNFDYWDKPTVRRATHAACRAVIAARRQDRRFDDAMTLAIQRAYYTQARDTSNETELLALAKGLGLDMQRFEVDFRSAETQAEFDSEMALTEGLGVESFPALILERDQSRWPIPLDYNDARTMLETIGTLLEG